MGSASSGDRSMGPGSAAGGSVRVGQPAKLDDWTRLLRVMNRTRAAPPPDRLTSRVAKWRLRAPRHDTVSSRWKERAGDRRGVRHRPGDRRTAGRAGRRRLGRRSATIRRPATVGVIRRPAARGFSLRTSRTLPPWVLAWSAAHGLLVNNAGSTRAPACTRAPTWLAVTPSTCAGLHCCRSSRTDARTGHRPVVNTLNAACPHVRDRCATPPPRAFAD